MWNFNCTKWFNKEGLVISKLGLRVQCVSQQKVRYGHVYNYMTQKTEKMAMIKACYND